MKQNHGQTNVKALRFFYSERKQQLFKTAFYSTIMDCHASCGGSTDCTSCLPIRSSSSRQAQQFQGARAQRYDRLGSFPWNRWLQNVNVTMAYARGLGLKPPWSWYVTKTLLPAQRRLFSHTFCLLICRLNAYITEWFCMQIWRNIVNGPQSNN